MRLKCRRLCVVEVSQQEQNGVRTGRVHRLDLLLPREEPLGEQREGGCLARTREISDVSVEALIDEDRDRCGTCRLECGRELGRIRPGPQRSGRRRPALDLCDRGQARSREGLPKAPH